MLGRMDDTAKYKDAINEYRNQALALGNLDAYLLRTIVCATLANMTALELIDYVITLQPAAQSRLRVSILEALGRNEAAERQKPQIRLT